MITYVMVATTKGSVWFDKIGLATGNIKPTKVADIKPAI